MVGEIITIVSVASVIAGSVAAVARRAFKYKTVRVLAEMAKQADIPKIANAAFRHPDDGAADQGRALPLPPRNDVQQGAGEVPGGYGEPLAPPPQ